jgi:hypothetical protein
VQGARRVGGSAFSDESGDDDGGRMREIGTGAKVEGAVTEVKGDGRIDIAEAE